MPIPFPDTVRDASSGLLAPFRKMMAERGVEAHFQPIIDLHSGRPLGYEGLVRGPQHSPLRSPAALFTVARMAGESVSLEALCREQHLQAFRQRALPGRLFVNMSPELLHADPVDDHDMPQWLTGPAGLAGGRLVVELTEGLAVTAYAELRQAIERLRRAGVALALDDLGEGFSSLRLWSEMRPDYVKIDKYFLNDIDADGAKRRFVRAMLEMARQVGTVVIAEGIETEAQCRTAIELGIRYGQGYWLARPEPEPPLQAPQVRGLMENLPQAGRVAGATATSLPVKTILREVPAVAHTEPTNAIHALFDSQPDVHVVAVLRGDQPIGLIQRLRLLDKLARPYHREIYGNRPCEHLLDNEPLIVDQSTCLRSLADRIAEDNPYQLSDGFIITGHGRFLGVGTGLDLIREMTRLQLNAARYANPLTGLPGNVPIDEHIDALLAAGTPFVVCYADLDQFKPFNDVYSYRKGDEVIQLAAALLAEHVDTARDFVGHIGGDDFIMVMRSPDWRERCERILRQFPVATRHLYDAAHLADAGYQAENRQGEMVFHGLVSLSIGAVLVPADCRVFSQELAQVASKAKSEAKKQAGNSLFVERRRLDCCPDAGETA